VRPDEAGPTGDENEAHTFSITLAPS
jgi:hypothetical protein